MNQQLKPYQLIIMISGAVMLIFSFLEWFGSDDVDKDWTAWSGGLLPLATLATIIGVVMAVQVAVNAFGSGGLPDRVAGFTWTQVHLVLAVYATIIMVGYLITTAPFEADRGIGLWFSLLGAIGLLVGAIMMRQDEVGPAAPAGGAPQSF